MTVKAVCVCDIHTGQRGAHSQIFDDEGRRRDMEEQGLWRRASPAILVREVASVGIRTRWQG
jgi:hypothetical protein